MVVLPLFPVQVADRACTPSAVPLLKMDTASIFAAVKALDEQDELFARVHPRFVAIVEVRFSVFDVSKGSKLCCISARSCHPLLASFCGHKFAGAQSIGADCSSCARIKICGLG